MTRSTPAISLGWGRPQLRMGGVMNSWKFSDRNGLYTTLRLGLVRVRKRHTLHHSAHANGVSDLIASRWS